MRVAFCTLGCKVNQYETQAMEQALRARGHEIVDFKQPADVYVINSCSVTAVSDKKSRQMIRRAKKAHPQALVAACGCYVQTHADEARELGVDLLGGSGERMAFLDALEKAWAQREKQECIVPAMSRRVFEPLPAGGMPQRTRAMLKIEDGCVNFCAYCIIPYARGPVRSLPPEQALGQLAALRQQGYREVVLTGIEISSYGQDLPGKPGLTELLEQLSAEAGSLRLRLGSLEPRTVTEDFCRRAAALPQLCPHFHLSLQSGCDATLRRMNRKYDTARFARSVELLRGFFPGCAVTTDLIVGFPEETEEEFAQTLSFIRRCGFAAMHIFPYSRRPGTPADRMEQVDEAVKEQRAKQAAQAARQMHLDYLRSCLGQTVPVLFEEEKDGLYRGHAPNYMEVSVQAEKLHNQILPVKLTEIRGGGLYGIMCEE